MATQEKVALVTGGARRVGRAIVLELARHGWDVAIHYRRAQDDARDLAGTVRKLGQRAIHIAADLQEASAAPELISRTISPLGRMDLLVNNAAMFSAEGEDTLERFDPSRWETMWRVNLLAPVALVHHAAPHLRRSGGCVVNLCDIAADRPWAGHLAYCASKAGLVAMTKALALSLAPRVRVNGVSPGIAVFPESYTADKRKRLTERVPLQREGSPEEMARTVRFLAESADYVTGQVIAVDGGRSLR